MKADPMASSTKSDGGIVETVKTLVYALLIAGVFRTLFFQPFWIPSESMKDTLLIGDFLFVNKMAYGYSRYSCPFALCPFSGRILGSDPVRGDVVVFRHPVNGSDFIKRLIGLPGDKIQVKNGILFVNGEEAKQVPDGVFEEVFESQGPMANKPRCENGPVGEGGIKVRESLHREMVVEHRHAILIEDRDAVWQAFDRLKKDGIDIELGGRHAVVSPAPGDGLLPAAFAHVLRLGPSLDPRVPEGPEHPLRFRSVTLPKVI